MCEREDKKYTYPFFWLDELLEVTLNPAKTNLKMLSTQSLDEIRSRLPVEIDRVNVCLKTQSFFLYCNEQLKVVAGHYDQSLRLLQRQAVNNLQQYPKKGALRQLGLMILNLLHELSDQMRDRYRSFLPDPVLPENDGLVRSSNFLDKILCALSADQLGIVLKSAFDVKLILGKSFRKVCKAVAPFLSTPWKSDISWDSIRSIAGRAELRDKEIAIEFLEKMIAAIKSGR